MVDSEDALLQILFTLEHPPLLRHLRWESVSAAVIASLSEDLMLFPPAESVWLAIANRLLHPPPPPAPEINSLIVSDFPTRGWLDSLIVSDFPPLFEEFRAKRFNLLWRGSRDRFTAQEFHRRCDGRATTLTLISDTKGNIFGGFTPVKWESSAPGEEGHRKGDDSPSTPASRRRQSTATPHSVKYWAAGTGFVTFVFPITATQTDTVTLTLALAMGVTARTRTTPPSSTSSRARRISQ
jgi:hypothetical protein